MTRFTVINKNDNVGDFEKAKQWGILFYIHANYTSTTDPYTGWRKHLYLSNTENKERLKQKFIDEINIKYNNKFECYQFSYKYNDKLWDLLAYKKLYRSYWSDKERKLKPYNLYEEFEKLFIGFDKTKSIGEQLMNIDWKDTQWKNLVFYWNLLNQIRNTEVKDIEDKKDNKDDFIQSPVHSATYNSFFDSREIETKELPQNGDANGAYNIARKGVMLLERIKQNKDKFDPLIKDEDWNDFSNDA